MFHETESFCVGSIFFPKKQQRNDWKPRLNYDTREVQVTQLAKLTEWIATKGGVQDRIFELLRKQFHLEDGPLDLVDSSSSAAVSR